MKRTSVTALLVGMISAGGSDPSPSAPIEQTPAENTGGRATGGAPQATGGANQATGGRPAMSGGGGELHGGSDGQRAGGSGYAGAGSRTATGGASSNAGSAACSDQTLDFRARCVACADSACALCLCNECTMQAELCEKTAGCVEIAACGLETGCVGAACFCGTADPLRCLAGEANGPCKDVIVGAPLGRVPTLNNPSAGPASDAAVALSACAEPSGTCAAECL
jgi:hypothetical protein